jgi:hypothetical protein
MCPFVEGLILLHGRRQAPVNRGPAAQNELYNILHRQEKSNRNRKKAAARLKEPLKETLKPACIFKNQR